MQKQVYIIIIIFIVTREFSRRIRLPVHPPGCKGDAWTAVAISAGQCVGAPDRKFRKDRRGRRTAYVDSRRVNALKSIVSLS